MGKIRHIALSSPDPFATAEFYKAAFDLKEVGRFEQGSNPFGFGVYLTDGVINLAILKLLTPQGTRAPDFVGIHHLGLLVDDVDTKREELERLGAVCFQQRPSADKSMFFETKFVGPDDVVFDISEHPWPLGSKE